MDACVEMLPGTSTSTMLTAGRCGNRTAPAALPRPWVHDGTKWEYVRGFEQEETLLPSCWGVIRLDGHSFTRCANQIMLQKPGF